MPQMLEVQQPGVDGHCDGLESERQRADLGEYADHFDESFGWLDASDGERAKGATAGQPTCMYIS